jgi:hypothetical protein
LAAALDLISKGDHDDAIANFAFFLMKEVEGIRKEANKIK